MTNLKLIEQVSNQLNNDLETVQKELKRIQSIKCRLKKQKGKSTYQSEMTEILQKEQVVKEVRNLLNPKDKFVTEFTFQDVQKLDYDETVKAIRSIQSKKTLTKWLTTTENDNDQYRNACSIEQMLIEHRNNIKPIDVEQVRKTEVQTIIDTIQGSGKLSQEKILELLQKLV